MIVVLNGILITRHCCKNNGILIIAGGLDRRNIGLIRNAGGMVLDRNSLGHDYLANRPKGTVISVVGKIITGTDIGNHSTTINTNSIEAKAIGSGTSPDTRVGGGTGSGVATSIGNRGTRKKRQRMIILGHNLIAMTGGSSNGNFIGGGGADSGDEGAQLDVEIVNGKGKLIEGVINILETGFDDVTTTGIRARGVLADSVGEGIVGGVFATGGNVEVSPIDNIRRGRKMLSSCGNRN